MKCIVLHQPWASLLVYGLKGPETRGRVCHVRGRIGIVAGKSTESLYLADTEPFKSALASIGYPDPSDLPLGKLVGRGDIVGCERTETIRDRLSPDVRAFGDYRDGRFAWLYEPFCIIYPPIPCQGGRGFFIIPDELLSPSPTN